MSTQENDNKPRQARLRFEMAATSAFAFLKDLGFSQIGVSPTIVRFRKAEVEADIYYGRRSFELGFEIRRGMTKFSLSELIRIIDPETAKKYRNFTATTQRALDEGLERLAELVMRYGQQALHGDPEVFTALEKEGKSWAESYALDVLARTLRPKADEAFRHGNYREAAELYERFRSRLAADEIKKLEIARKRAPK